MYTIYQIQYHLFDILLFICVVFTFFSSSFFFLLFYFSWKPIIGLQYSIVTTCPIQWKWTYTIASFINVYTWLSKIISRWEIFTSVKTRPVFYMACKCTYLKCHCLHQCYEKYPFSSATKFHLLQQINFSIK